MSLAESAIQCDTRDRKISFPATALICFFNIALAGCSGTSSGEEELDRRRAILRKAGSRSNGLLQPARILPPGADLAPNDPALLAFIAAARAGDIQDLKTHLARQPAGIVNTRVAGGETALTHAVWFGRTQAAAVLLQAHADPDIKTDGGDTALHYAIRRDRPRMVALLLDAGADIKIAERRGYTPLMIAAGLGRQAMTERLIALGAPVEVYDKERRTALLHAIRGGHGRSARRIIHRKTIHQTDEAGETALFYAVRKNDLATFEALLVAGAQVDARNQFGETPLMTAAFFGRPLFVERLLAAGADVRLRDEHGVYDALLIARTGGHQKIAEMIESPPGLLRKIIERLRPGAGSGD